MKILKMILKLIGLKKVVSGLLDSAVEPALRKAVAKTKTDLDDRAMDALYPILKQELLKAVAKL